MTTPIKKAKTFDSKDLECPVCFVIRSAPIYQCPNGHLICSSCHAKVVNCPQCQIAMGKIRCRFAEQMLDRFSEPCKFSENGCKILFFRDDQAVAHETSCGFRDVECAICEDFVPLSRLTSHLDDKHKEEYVRPVAVGVKPATRGQISMFSIHTEDSVGCFTFLGKMFILRTCLFEDDCWYFWMVGGGTKVEMQNFVFNLRVYDKGVQDEFHLSNGRIVSIDDDGPWSCVRADRDGLVLPENMINRVRKNGKFLLDVEVVQR